MVTRQTIDLIEAVASKAIPEGVVHQIAERSGAIPLFAEELTKALVEDVSPLTESALPVTRQAIACRAHRLPGFR
ncbi:MAG: hypothetical protein HOI95_07450 [Chromatiales bacterium]|nr:hypothetical protein [Chromatiales bacterium]